MRSEITTNPTLDPLLDCLSQYRRRFVVEFLAKRDDPVDSAELAAALGRYEREAERRPDCSTTQVATDLRHTHLPKLVDAGVIDDRDGQLTLRDETARAVLSGVATAREQRPEPMATSTAGATPASATRATYRPDQERLLTDAIRSAVADHRGDDVRWRDFDLCEGIDPDSLNTLFRPETASDTRLTLTTATVRIALWADDGIAIRVTDGQ